MFIDNYNSFAILSKLEIFLYSKLQFNIDHMILLNSALSQKKKKNKHGFLTQTLYSRF